MQPDTQIKFPNLKIAIPNPRMIPTVSGNSKGSN